MGTSGGVMISKLVKKFVSSILTGGSHTSGSVPQLN